MIHAVIMAGGSGTRFWPESRAARPKQLLPLAGELSMLQTTVRRLGALVPLERVLIATNEALVPAVAEQFPELESGSILGEPCKRDTAPCIGLAALLILRTDHDATMVVMPADHVIKEEEAFRAALGYADQLLLEDPTRLVTFGIRPTYPAESFGYAERGERITPPKNVEQHWNTYRVQRFREKPQGDLAREFFEAGTFYWNSGIFVWKAKAIVDALSRFQPEMAEHLRRIADTAGTPAFEETFRREFSAIKGISIDFAVMEQADNVVVIEAPFSWDDVGSWQAMARLHPADSQGNTVLAQHLGIDTARCIVRGPDGHLIVTLGLQDCVVVHTPDATLIADKSQEEAVRQVVKQINERGWDAFL